MTDKTYQDVGKVPKKQYQNRRKRCHFIRKIGGKEKFELPLEI
jgi:hypothetical protein